MKTHKLVLPMVLILFLLGQIVTSADTGLSHPTAIPAPVLFFTDLISGPKTGGQDNLGAFVTIYGENFGATRGTSTVTLGGVEVAKYVSWGQDNGIARALDKIVVQPGPNVTSGSIVVTVNGTASNPLAFTIRTGQIYFVIPGAPNADDDNPGTYAEPFKTIYRPRQVMLDGDIVYIKGGTIGTIDPSNPGWDTILILDADTAAVGTADRPIAYVGYPGDGPVLANPAARRGILLQTSGEPRNYYVLANLTFSQSLNPLPLTGIGQRVVGNYLHDGAFDDSGTIGVNGNSSEIKILGNLLRNNGIPGPESKHYHGVYLGGYGTNEEIEVGWNEIQDQNGGRGIQVYGHLDGDQMNNIRIHDNLVSGSQLNNILLGGTDGSTEVLGTVYVYNNIIVGSGDPGLRVSDPQGTVIIRNNVIYNNGSPGFDGKAQLYIQRAGTGLITLQDNIVYAEPGQTYFLIEADVGTAALNASHNLVYNAGACPAWDAACINADPLFESLASGDFRLQSLSPAIDAGIDTGILRDYAGTSRPQGGAYDIGAFEYITVADTETPTPTRTRTPTATKTATSSRTPTRTPTNSPTATPTRTLTPTATRTATPTRALTPTATVTATTTPASADLRITKKVKQLSATRHRYKLSILNAGSGTATNLKITDRLPKKYQVIRVRRNGATCTVRRGRAITCTLAALNSGSTLNLKIIAAPNGAKGTNCASVTSGIADPNLGNNTACVNVPKIEEITR